MKLRLIIMLLINFPVFVQGIFGFMKADTIPCDSGQIVIEIACTPTLNNVPLQEGDIIIVNYDDGVYTAADSIIFETYGVDSATLTGIFPETTETFDQVIHFTLYSDSGSCYTSYVDFNIDESATNLCYMRIDRFNALRYNVDYPLDRICIGGDSIPLLTNAPEITILDSDNLTCINADGVINPQYCSGGNYTITFSSPYCLSSYSTQITLLESQRIDVPDTIPLCSGDPIYNYPEYSRLVFYEPGSLYGADYDQLNTEGVYVVGRNDYECMIPDTAFVMIIESPPIDLDIEEECDRVIVRYNNSYEEGLIINWTNGEIDDEVEIYNDTVIGINVMNYAGCSSFDSVAVVRHPLSIPSVDFEAEDASCWLDGSITITEVAVVNNVGTVRYQLRNRLNDRIYNSLEGVPEGLYNLEVVDTRNCIATYEENITIRQRCLEDYPVFTPNGDDIEDSYFIPHEGSVKIYTIEGKLIRSLNTPAYWDGDDEAGNPQPMGTYVIITDNERIVNITIVK